MLIAAAVLGYLFGSIPFGVILTRLGGTQDLRAIGSGSTGATNVLRTGRKGLAAGTLLGDMLKGTAAVIVAGWFAGADGAMLAGLFAFLGHCFPIWLRFRGGKGVATYIGVALGLFWPAALLFCGVWILIAIASRYSSLAALLASIAVPPFLYWLDQAVLAVLFAVLTLMLWIMHRANISRLASGREGKIGAKAGDSAMAGHNGGPPLDA